MPVSVEQLRKMKARDPKRYEKQQKEVFAFSKLLFSAYEKLRGGDEKDVRISKKLYQYSEALQQVRLDPAVPENREKIDGALDTLATLDDFLGSRAEEHDNSSVCDHLLLETDTDVNALRDGLHAVSAHYGFDLDVERLIEGNAIERSEQQEQERRELLRQWREQRAREREQTLEQERRAAEARERARLTEEQKKKAQKELEEKEKRETEAAERKERERQAKLEEERRKSELQKMMERAAPQAKAVEDERARRTAMQSDVDTLMIRARDPKRSADMRKADLAQAVAFSRELNDVGQDMSKRVSLDRVNRTMNDVLSGAALTVAEKHGTLDELAAMSVTALNEHVIRMERDVGAYAEGSENSAARADKLFRQMDRTWRVGGSSAAYRAAVQAMQDVAGKNPPAQVDNYLATETVRAYVAKNVSEAKHATGRTRMACSLAFLKQTMSREQFRAYCNALNMQRGVGSQITANGIEYDKTNPRAFIPEEIGTISEVYADTRERFYHLYDEETGFKMPPARDLALLTALKRLQAKANGNGDLAVEHEALQEEIEKVQADRRFQAAIHNRSAHELIEMACGGNLDTLAGYADPLTDEQKARVEEEKNLRAAKEAARIAKAEADRIAREEAERLAKEEAERQEQERIRLEQERIQREKAEAEFRAKNKPLSELFEKLLPDVQELGKEALEDVFDYLDDEHTHRKSVEKTCATLIALHEVRLNDADARTGKKNPIVNLETLQKRVDELKKDPFVQELAKDPNIAEKVRSYGEAAQNKTNLAELGKKIFPAVRLAEDLHGDYQKKLEAKAKAERLKAAWEKGTTVAVAYQDKNIQDGVKHLLSGKIDYQSAANIAAAMIAIRECEEKGGGLDAHLDFKALQQRKRELLKDPVIEKLGQYLSSPFRGKELERAVNLSENREQSVAGALNKMYQQRLAEKQQKPEEQKAKENQSAAGGIHA